MEEKIVSYNNPVFAFWNLVKPTDIETYNKGPQPDGLDMKDEGWWAKHMEWSEKQNDRCSSTRFSSRKTDVRDVKRQSRYSQKCC